MAGKRESTPAAEAVQRLAQDQNPDVTHGNGGITSQGTQLRQQRLWVVAGHKAPLTQLPPAVHRTHPALRRLMLGGHLLPLAIGSHIVQVAGVCASARRAKRLSAGVRPRLQNAHASSSAISTVLPLPVAILQA